MAVVLDQYPSDNIILRIASSKGRLSVFVICCIAEVVALSN